MSALLNPGDTIAIVSPSISLARREKIEVEKAANYFQNLGLKVLMTDTACSGLRLTADSDVAKARDIMEMYQNPQVKALVAAHGGASSLRILEHLDFDVIRNNPKPFIGFSDSSSIQMGIYSQTGLPYVSGFLCEYDFRSGEIDSLVSKDLQNVIKGQKFFAQEGLSLHPGLAEGNLVGGNLSILSDLNGTPYYPNIRNAILLIEDECEKPYKLALMLTQLRLNPLFKEVKGIIFGKFSECEDTNSTHGSLDDVIADFSRHVNLPMIRDFNYGHFPSRHVLTFGVPYRLDAGLCRLEQIA